MQKKVVSCIAMQMKEWTHAHFYTLYLIGNIQMFELQSPPEIA